MKNREAFLIDGKESIENLVNEIFDRYKRRVGNVILPINENILVTVIEELKGIEIELKEEKKKVLAQIDEGILIPKKGGFILRYGLNPYKGKQRIFSPVTRKRFTICHELAHILFYDFSYIVPKLHKSPQEHTCHEIARKLLLPEEAMKKKYYEEYKPGTNLIPFLRKLAKDAKVSLYPLAIRLTEELSLLKDSMITFWEYVGNRSQPEIHYKSFHPDSKTCSELRRLLQYYWRHKIYIKAWDEVVREVANDKVPRKKSLSIEGKRRKKGKLKCILFDVECETLVDLSNGQTLLKWINPAPLLSVEKFDLFILEKGK